MIVLCRMATAVADWAHARAAREYARTLLTGPHCCATTSFDHASPTSHRAQRECPATQIARHGCRQHAWAVRAHRDTVILTQHNTSFQGHQFLARCVPHGQPGMPPGMSHARALCTRVAQPWRAWSWRVRRQQWRRTVAPSELGRADRALFRSRTYSPQGERIGLGVLTIHITKLHTQVLALSAQAGRCPGFSPIFSR